MDTRAAWDPGSWNERAWAAHLGRTATASELRDELAGRCLPALQHASAAARPDHLAFDVDGDRITHGALARRTAGAVGWLCEHGVGRGTRVLLCGSTSVPYVTAYLALLAAGATVVLASPSLTVPELGHIAADARTPLVLAGGAGLDAARALADEDPGLEVLAYDATGPGTLSAAPAPGRAPAPPAPDTPALIAYTSGTTGRPKGAVLSHANLVASIRAAMMAWRWTPDDVLVHALPLSHQHGLSGVHATVAAGSTAVLSGRFEPDRLVTALRDHAASVLFAVPAMYDQLTALDSPGALPALRLPVSGSAPLAPASADRVRAWLGQAPLERYGTTESGLDVSHLLTSRHPGRVGWPLPGVELQLRTPAGEPVTAYGAEGEICVRGPQVFAGYLDDAAATEEAFWPGGWFRTGDLATVDPDRGVAIVGRRKELIITGGHNVYPREVEVVLQAHPDVAEVAVVGVPDERWGEAVTAYVVPAPGAGLDRKALAAHARARLAAYKCPKRVVALEELPRNALGKVQRHLLAGEEGTEAAGLTRPRPAKYDIPTIQRRGAPWISG